MRSKAIARIGVLVGGLIGWFGFNAVMAFYTYLWRTSPDSPDFTAGRIMPMHQQSRIFYVQPWEQRLVLIGLAICLALVFLAAALILAFFRRELTQRPGVSWLNAGALVAFLGLVVYAAWPLPHR